MKANTSSVTAEEMRKLDELASASGINTLQLMESAGLGVARVASLLLGKPSSVTVLAGKGNNGGDALVASRYLSNWGCEVSVILASESLGELASRQFQSLSGTGISILSHDDKDAGNVITKASLVIDGLLGYGLKGNPREPYSSLIEKANSLARAILSVDVPSGLDSTTGMAMNPCIKAQATATLGLPKKGLFSGDGKALAGKVYLVDIGIPLSLYSRFGIDTESLRSIFREGIGLIRD